MTREEAIEIFKLADFPKAEPCEDAISREAVLELIDDHSGGYDYIEEGTEYLKNSIRELPSVSPTRASDTTEWLDSSMPICAKCGYVLPMPSGTPYCPNCGRKAKGVKQ